jgi:hypothetical protein
MLELRLSPGTKIFASILLAILLIPAVSIALSPLFTNFFVKGYLVLGPISYFLTGFCVYALLQMNETTIIDDFSVRRQSRFDNRELQLHQIQGYRTDKNYLYLIPFPGQGKKIKLSNWLSSYNEALAWAASRYQDLDEAEGMKIYEDPSLNMDKAEIDRHIKRAKLEIYLLNGIIVVLGLLPWLLGATPWWRTSLLILGPLVALCLMYRHKGFVQLGDLKKSPAPGVFFPIALSAAALIISTNNIHVLKYDRLWSPAIGITALLTLLLFYFGGHFEWRKQSKIVTGIMFLIFFFIHGYASALLLNLLTDKAAPQQYETLVENKRISKGKSTTYYLQLHPWGPRTSAEEVSVPSEVYKHVDIDGVVIVHLYKGGLGVPWYHVTLP